MEQGGGGHRVESSSGGRQLLIEGNIQVAQDIGIAGWHEDLFQLVPRNTECDLGCSGCLALSQPLISTSSWMLSPLPATFAEPTHSQ